MKDTLFERVLRFLKTRSPKAPPTPLTCEIEDSRSELNEVTVTHSFVANVYEGTHPSPLDGCGTEILLPRFGLIDSISTGLH